MGHRSGISKIKREIQRLEAEWINQRFPKYQSEQSIWHPWRASINGYRGVRVFGIPPNSDRDFWIDRQLGWSPCLAQFSRFRLGNCNHPILQFQPFLLPEEFEINQVVVSGPNVHFIARLFCKPAFPNVKKPTSLKPDRHKSLFPVTELNIPFDHATPFSAGKATICFRSHPAGNDTTDGLDVFKNLHNKFSLLTCDISQKPHNFSSQLKRKSDLLGQADPSRSYANTYIFGISRRNPNGHHK